MLSRMVGDERRQYPDPIKIGQRAWKRICSDKMLTVRPLGENVADVQTAISKLVEAEKKAADAEARALTAERKLEKLEKEGPASSAQAQAEIIRLQGVIEKQNKLIDEANDKAAKAQAERDELNKQLEQLTAPAIESTKKGKRG